MVWNITGDLATQLSKKPLLCSSCSRPGEFELEIKRSDSGSKEIYCSTCAGNIESSLHKSEALKPKVEAKEVEPTAAQAGQVDLGMGI